MNFGNLGRQHLEIEYYQPIYLLIFHFQNEERFFTKLHFLDYALDFDCIDLGDLRYSIFRCLNHDFVFSVAVIILSSFPHAL